jgi:plastocyanin
MSPLGNFPHLSYRTRREEMLCMMNNSYLPRRMALCGLTVALLLVLAGCGGSGNVATNTSTATAGPTSTTPSPTSTQPGETPTQSRPSPTPTKAKPTPTSTRTPPTPTPTRATPTPTPKPSPTPAPTTMNVTIVDNGGFAFSPQMLNITIGTTIIWKNHTTAPHTVTSDNGVFDSGTIAPGGTFSFKFMQAGTFAYHCNIHPFMTATIVVK